MRSFFQVPERVFEKVTIRGLDLTPEARKSVKILQDVFARLCLELIDKTHQTYMR